MRQLFDLFTQDDTMELTDMSVHATPTQQQQTTSLVILGMIGAEFNSTGKTTPTESRKGSKGTRRRGETHTGGTLMCWREISHIQLLDCISYLSFVVAVESSLEESEILDPAIARQTAKTLQAVLLEKPAHRSSIYSSLRCSAAELMGRGFHLWENYVDVAAVIMGLLDLAITPGLPSLSGADEKSGKRHRAIKFMADIARRALNLMVLLRPVTIVSAIAKEVSVFLVSTHSGSSYHSSLPQLQVCLGKHAAGYIVHSAYDYLGVGWDFICKEWE